MHRRMPAHRRRITRAAAALALASGIGIIVLAGCEIEPRGGPVSLAPDDQPLFPPIRLDRASAGTLVALVSEQDPAHSSLAALALYRADEPTAAWSRWSGLPLPPGCSDVDLAIGVDRVAVVASYGESLHVASLPLDALQPTNVIETTTLRADSTILGLALGASLGVGESSPAHHLLILSEAGADSGRVLHHRRSDDGGRSWGPPQLLAHGVLGEAGIFARSERADVIDVVYLRDGFLRRRGNTHGGRRWSAEREIRLRVDAESPIAVARLGHLVLAVAESDRHQVVCSSSRNGGHNWERATALARQADKPRHPSADSGFGRFWVVFAERDSMLFARTTSSPWHPQQWSERIPIVPGPFAGCPAIRALPDSSAAVLYATPEGRVRCATTRWAEAAS
ncbi:MAG: hypothetical protein GF330_03115 [Candidatus Eisenbacteria bacterium]|nr:hypothetical protein [Candidatus Eisenbacteria bacterium]